MGPMTELARANGEIEVLRGEVWKREARIKRELEPRIKELEGLMGYSNAREQELEDALDSIVRQASKVLYDPEGE